LQTGRSGTGDNLSRGKVIEFGQVRIEPAHRRVMAAENLHGIRLKLRQLPIELDVPMPLAHTIYSNYTLFHLQWQQIPKHALEVRIKPADFAILNWPTLII
jgi:hypothetical protein